MRVVHFVGDNFIILLFSGPSRLWKPCETKENLAILSEHNTRLNKAREHST